MIRELNDQSKVKRKSLVRGGRLSDKSSCMLVLLKRVYPLVLAIIIGLMVVFPVCLAQPVRAHMITNVPWHQQLNALSCGAAALEIVFDYWGPDINQKEIMNVARTSSAGTWTFDMERTGQFSYLSDAQGRFFPSEGPVGGLVERSLGFASFSHSSSMCWLDELKTLIDMNIPVIVLMSYTPSGGGGHYRVVIGYNDSQQLIYFSDPWGRDTNHLTGWTGVISWSYSDFETGWNYIESGSANPYFGVAIIPWSVDIDIKGTATKGSTITVTASIQYPCPEPFDNTQYPAKDAMAHIILPAGTILSNPSTTIYLRDLKAGNSATATWAVFCAENVVGKTVSVSACGTTFGGVPEAHSQGKTVHYPAYAYSDVIGGQETAFL
jgi:hypothetical protein